MRAAILRGGALTVGETPDPVPGSGQLLVRTLSTAICASDVHFMDHPETIDGDPRYLYDADRDIVMGHEFIGEIVGYGPDCTRELTEGTRVTSLPVLLQPGSNWVIGQHPGAPGSFGELFLLSEKLARRVPDGVTDDAVALVDPFAVGEFNVRVLGDRRGRDPDRAGRRCHRSLRRSRHWPVATSHRSSCRTSRPIVASWRRRSGPTCSSIPPSESPFAVWRELARERGTKKPPVVYECVGVPGMLQSIVDDCTYLTRIFAAGGHYTGDQLSVTAATQKGVRISFAGGPGMVDWYGTLDAVCAGELDPTPCIGEVVGLDGLPDALDRARHSEGPPRIVVHPRD